MLHVFFPGLNDSENQIFLNLRKKRDKCIKIWIPRSEILAKHLSDCKDLKPIESSVKVDWELLDEEWDCEKQTVFTVQDAFKHWMTMYSSYGGKDEWIIVTSERKPKDRYTLFRDHKSDNSYPKEWMIFPCIQNQTELDTFISNRNFLIYQFKEGDRFEKVHENFKHIRGSVVLRDKRTGYYWYLDTLHRNHFEVFDADGKHHLGEADTVKGELDMNKADNRKMPIL